MPYFFFGVPDDEDDDDDDDDPITFTSSHQEFIAAVSTNLHNAVSADEVALNMWSLHEDTITVLSANEDPVTVSVDEASPTASEIDWDEACPSVTDSDGVLLTRSTMTQSQTPRRVRRFFGRMSRTLICCCSTSVEE